MHRRVSVLAVLILMGFIAFAPAARAQTVVTARNGVVWNDFIDWIVLGTVETAAANPSSFNTNGGLGATVSQAGGAFGRANNGGTWGGNFALGDHLITTFNSTGPVTITFASLIAGGGAQLQSNNSGTFTAFIDALDASNSVLASFSVSGFSSGIQDNTAIFLGVKSNTTNIKSLRFNVQNPGTTNDRFAINRVDLLTVAAGTPEPGALTLALALGVPVLLRLRKSRRMTNDQ